MAAAFATPSPTSEVSRVKSFRLGIQGIAPLLMNRPGAGMTGNRSGSGGRLTPEEQAEAVASRLPDGQLYLSADALFRAIVEAAEGATLKRVVVAALVLPPVALPFTPRLDSFEVDARSVVLPGTGRRVMRYRPRLDEWALETRVDIDDEILDPGLCRHIVESAGRWEGVGDYRAGRGGPYGRFIVAEWASLAEPATAREHAAF